jgi:hypothetical protein
VDRIVNSCPLLSAGLRGWSFADRRSSGPFAAGSRAATVCWCTYQSAVRSRSPSQPLRSRSCAKDRRYHLPRSAPKKIGAHSHLCGPYTWDPSQSPAPESPLRSAPSSEPSTLTGRGIGDTVISCTGATLDLPTRRNGNNGAGRDVFDRQEKSPFAHKSSAFVSELRRGRRCHGILLGGTVQMA